MSPGVSGLGVRTARPCAPAPLPGSRTAPGPGLPSKTGRTVLRISPDPPVSGSHAPLCLSRGLGLGGQTPAPPPPRIWGPATVSDDMSSRGNALPWLPSRYSGGVTWTQRAALSPQGPVPMCGVDPRGSWDPLGCSRNVQTWVSGGSGDFFLPPLIHIDCCELNPAGNGKC